MAKRLLVVADRLLVFESLRRALRETAGVELVGRADGRRALDAVLDRLRPDFVLIDEMQDFRDALARVREVSDRGEAGAIVLVSRADDAAVDSAFDAGADAVLSSAMHAVAFATAVREISRGNVRLRSRRTEPPGAGATPLTSRETQILSLAAQGLTNGRIARELWITEQTVKFHLSNCYRKLGVENRTQASRYAYLHALVAPAAEQLAS